MKLSNKIILITGAGSGLGKELAHQLNDSNNKLILIDVNVETLKKTISSLKNLENIYEYVMDTSIETKWKELHKYLSEKELIPDIIINNAGRNMSDIDVEFLQTKDFEKIFNNNFYSTFFGSREFIGDLKKKKSKCAIINIASSLSLFAVYKSATYTTSKFAINGFTQTLRQELRDTNIIVSIVYPGSIDTNIVINGHLAEGTIVNDELLKMVNNNPKNAWTKTNIAVKQILNGIKKEKKRILIGKDTKLMDFASRLTPVLYDIIIIKFAKNIFK